LICVLLALLRNPQENGQSPDVIGLALLQIAGMV